MVPVGEEERWALALRIHSELLSGCGEEEVFAKSTESIDFRSTNGVETPRGLLEPSVRD